MDILSLTAVELAKAIREGKTTAVVSGGRFGMRSQPVRIPTTAM